MEEKPIQISIDNKQVNVIRLEEGDNSGCWICGGFSINKKMKNNWHCYICSGHETIQENGIETHCKYCIIPPFNYQIYSYQKDIFTGHYIKNNKKSCWWYVFSCGKEIKGYNRQNNEDDCCISCWVPDSDCYPSDELQDYRDLKCSSSLGPGCCSNSFEGIVTQETFASHFVSQKTFKTSCCLNPFYYSGKKLEENTAEQIKREQIYTCYWTPISFMKIDNTKVGEETKFNNYCCIATPFNFYNKKNNNLSEYVKKIWCIPPVYASDETINNKKVESKNFFGICPFICCSTKENDGEYKKDIYGSIGPLSYCKSIDIKNNIKTSNYCVTCLFGIGFCKRGRCCKLIDVNLNSCCSPFRYLQPSEYEFCFKVDNLRTKSCTCFGLGNCEVIPINQTKSNVVVPVQEVMNEIMTMEVTKEESPENISSIIRIRSMFGEKNIYSKCK